MGNIGKLVEVDVRELWQHEQYDFSTWLSKEDNIEYLNDILGLTLVEVNTEVYVGPYRCDIVATDETSGTSVIIENQLESTNHDHLGKIITYASGLNAKVIVWIVTEAREEHRAAIEWLNNNTVNDINFFLIELHAYKIGDSASAPKFEVIEKPNDFVKKTNNQTSKSESRRYAERIYFWELFNEKVIHNGKPFNIRNANKVYWYDISIGSKDAHIAVGLINKNGYIVVELYINDNKELFDKLYENKNEIEKELGFVLDWKRLNDKKASSIRYYIKGLNFDDHSNYDILMEQVIDIAVKMRDTFKRYL